MFFKSFPLTLQIFLILFAFVGQPVRSESLNSSSTNANTTIPTEMLQEIINKGKPTFNINIDGKIVKNISFNARDNNSYSLLINALEAFDRYDSGIRGGFPEEEVEKIKKLDYLEIQLQRWVDISRSNRNHSVEVYRLLIPLSERETNPEWNFYRQSRAYHKGWSMDIWTKPNLDTIKLIRKLAIDVINSNRETFQQ